MQAILLAIVISFLAGGGLSGFVVHKIGVADYSELKAKVANAESEGLKQAEALRKEYDLKRAQDASAWESQKLILQSQSKTIVQRTQTYVKDPNSCITFGALRLLDGEILGTSAERLPIPAGKSNDSCSGISPIVFYSTLVSNLNSCRQNSAQLNSLISSIKGKIEPLKNKGK